MLMYEKSFDVFSEEFVKAKIIKDEGIFYMKKLEKAFVNIVARVEGLDASNYKRSRLKERMQKHFPQLVFFVPRSRNKSEIVYCGNVKASSIVEEVVQGETSQSSSADNEEETYCLFGPPKTLKRDVYNTALFLKGELESKRNVKWYDTWPPVASEINGDNVRKLVSPALFNFFAWVLGFSDEPEDTDYVGLDEKEAVKVFSICQDLLNVYSGGKIQTPKSLSLAMAVRQISGCSSLITMLNGMGHCVSLPSTMAYDSGLAQLAMNKSTSVPKEFVSGKHINLVYDNIDFKEDANKQTHVTNGIIIQELVEDTTSEHEQEQSYVPIKKTQRTVVLPTSTVTSYNIGVKITPAFDCSALEPSQIASQNQNKASARAEMIDFIYTIIKKFANDDDLWPGWTGFNTLLRQDKIPPMSRIGYLPIIDASPTEYSTLHEVLIRSVKILNDLKLQQAVLVFDEALYAKIQHIRWKNQEFCDRFIVRLGEFHACMSFLSTVSKLFEEAGLKV